MMTYRCVLNLLVINACKLKQQVCENNGKCSTAGNDTFVCECIGRWTGRRCRECKCPRSYDHQIPSSYCNIEGRCKCPVGYAFNEAANRCQHTIEYIQLFGRACKYIPCANNGICLEENGNLDVPQYKCMCPSDTYGKNCQFKKQCNPNPCLNEGTCLERDGKFQGCACKEGYNTTLCKKEAVPVCKPNPCQNGAMCVPHTDGGYDCMCTKRYTGPHCTIDRCRDCDENANCTNGKCVCNVGFVGTGYECVRKGCTRQCLHFQTCIDNQCQCIPGHRQVYNICIPLTDIYGEAELQEAEDEYTYQPIARHNGVWTSQPTRIKATSLSPASPVLKTLPTRTAGLFSPTVVHKNINTIPTKPGPYDYTLPPEPTYVTTTLQMIHTHIPVTTTHQFIHKTFPPTNAGPLDYTLPREPTEAVTTAIPLITEAPTDSPTKEVKVDIRPDVTPLYAKEGVELENKNIVKTKNDELKKIGTNQSLQNNSMYSNRLDRNNSKLTGYEKTKNKTSNYVPSKGARKANKTESAAHSAHVHGQGIMKKIGQGNKLEIKNDKTKVYTGHLTSAASDKINIFFDAIKSKKIKGSNNNNNNKTGEIFDVIDAISKSVSVINKLHQNKTLSNKTKTLDVNNNASIQDQNKTKPVQYRMESIDFNNISTINNSDFDDYGNSNKSDDYIVDGDNSYDNDDDDDDVNYDVKSMKHKVQDVYIPNELNVTKGFPKKKPEETRGVLKHHITPIKLKKDYDDETIPLYDIVSLTHSYKQGITDNNLELIENSKKTEQNDVQNDNYDITSLSTNPMQDDIIVKNIKKKKGKHLKYINVDKVSQNFILR